MLLRFTKARQKHAARARVIVVTDDGSGTTEIMHRSGLSKPVVWRRQERFMREGVDGQLRKAAARAVGQLWVAMPGNT